MIYEEGEDTKVMRERLLQGLAVSDLARREGAALPREGVHTLTIRPDRLFRFFQEGSWTPRGEVIEGQGDALLTCMQKATRGILEFDMAWDDGPGVALTMGVAPGQRPTLIVPLPGVANPNPDQFRHVVVDFNFAARSLLITVDGLQVDLGDRPRLPGNDSVFGWQLLGRTRAKLRNVQLVVPRRGAAQ